MRLTGHRIYRKWSSYIVAENQYSKLPLPKQYEGFEPRDVFRPSLPTKDANFSEAGEQHIENQSPSTSH
jgi:hypothetical protein